MNNINSEEFGAFLYKLRKEKGFTQKQIAQRLFVTDKAVSKWERGLSLPDISIILPLAQTLDVTATELLSCERIAQDGTFSAQQTEELIKKMLAYPKIKFYEKLLSQKEDFASSVKKVTLLAIISVLACAFIYLYCFFVLWFGSNFIPDAMVGVIADAVCKAAVLINALICLCSLYFCITKSVYYAANLLFGILNALHAFLFFAFFNTHSTLLVFGAELKIKVVVYIIFVCAYFCVWAIFAVRQRCKNKFNAT